MHTGAIGNTGVRGFIAESFGDERGWLSPVGVPHTLVPGQINTVFTSRALTLRGLHYQAAPFAQDKFIRVLRGSIFDVAVDLRTKQATTVSMSSSWTDWLFVPAGHAHGYMTLRPDTIVEYLVCGPYEPAAERGLRWDDPALGISWPRPPEYINERDASWPLIVSEPVPA